jgi:Y-X(10)_GDL-associated radical SAM protein
MSRPARLRTAHDFRRHVPVHVVWEITLACNLKCRHCGSRAGRPRPDELSTSECLDLVERLARLGTREVTLIGGEAYLRRDWTEIVRAIRGHGMYCAIQTGGRNLTGRRLEAAVAAGLQGLGVSVDGLPALHDEIRGVAGSYEMAIDALVRARALGLRTSVNTVISAPGMSDLPGVLERIVAAGASHWQLQLAVAMGNAADNDRLLLQPFQLKELMPLLARLFHEGLDRGVVMTAGNNIGYFGPYERLWRSYSAEWPHWTGCSAGQTVLGIESDGTIKGCPSLATARYAGGNLRDLSLEQIWDHSEPLHFGRLRSAADLWGFCRGCYYAEVCRGGCTWTADSLFGRPGNNPYCHYRVLELDKRGLRERIVKRREAASASFATGEFELILEPVVGRQVEVASAVPAPAAAETPPPLVQIGQRASPTRSGRSEGRVPPTLEICRACDCFIWPGEVTCPHCGADVAAAAAIYDREATRRATLIMEVERLIAARKLALEAAAGQAGTTNRL